MTLRRAAALAVAALALSGCGLAATETPQTGAAPSASTNPATATPASATPAGDATLPGSGSDQPDPDDPALDVALSEPVEDSKYPDVGDPGVDALHYDLDLAWTPSSRTLDGRAGIELRATTDADHLQLDLSAALTVASVTLDGADVAFAHPGKDLVVQAPVRADQRYVLVVTYSGSPQPAPAPTTRSDFSTTGWTVTDTGETWTMQEPYGAYTWYPVNDQPSDNALYDITATAPAPWVAVANGRLVDQTTTDGQTTSAWSLDTPASSYLVTLAIGDYQHTSATSSSGVQIDYWVPAAHPELAARLAYAPTGLDWLEQRLGPYPFDSLGFLVVDSESGMETQTMITLGTTDYDTSPDVLVHEMAHQWYGDQVTPDDWSDLWMNEGMAMYLQGAWQADQQGVDVESVMDQWARIEPELRADYGPPGDYVGASFGESNVYYGPALMWDELRKRIGEAKFDAVTRAWPALEPDRSSNRDEYLPWLVARTGVPRSFFDAWLLSPTTPERS